MNKKKYLALNFSNQGNLCNANKTILCQYNLGTILGLGFLNQSDSSVEPPSLDEILISIFLNKEGEIEINGVNNINDDNIYIYTDKKITKG
ncbi:hypothetical protein GM661_09490 [Iocasia frigidifontis]|uniref:Uncharacterized protein n=1 Tax=Iocasia fonsfrigidae TaxID=2682810 RepID=A0A8A7K8X0_9FIRM|nr:MULTISPECIES: hypothetical protein [Halanaerobiaceae]AZO95317.1 hypothetical protein D7D81_12325 [Halocella sp. SP3-1]QTL98196.1 hypothetical protein GM661_09490 [Iocasia fonsfrigidae]